MYSVERCDKLEIWKLTKLFQLIAQTLYRHRLALCRLSVCSVVYFSLFALFSCLSMSRSKQTIYYLQVSVRRSICRSDKFKYAIAGHKRMLLMLCWKASFAFFLFFLSRRRKFPKFRECQVWADVEQQPTLNPPSRGLVLLSKRVRLKSIESLMQAYQLCEHFNILKMI